TRVFQNLLCLIDVWGTIGGEVHVLDWLGRTNHGIRNSGIQRREGITVDILSDGCAINRCRYSLAYSTCLFFISFLGFCTKRLGIEVEDNIANFTTRTVDHLHAVSPA